MLENECKQLRRDISTIEELKKSAEQQNRNYEQEVTTLLGYMGIKLIAINNFNHKFLFEIDS